VRVPNQQWRKGMQCVKTWSCSKEKCPEECSLHERQGEGSLLYPGMGVGVMEEVSVQQVNAVLHGVVVQQGSVRQNQVVEGKVIRVIKRYRRVEKTFVPARERYASEQGARCERQKGSCVTSTASKTRQQCPRKNRNAFGNGAVT